MKVNERLMNLLLTPIKNMGFDYRVPYACHRENIKYFVQALSPSKDTWLRTPSLGAKSFDQIKKTIIKTGFSVGALEQFKKDLLAANTDEELRTFIGTNTSLQTAIIASFHGDLPPQLHWMYSLFPEDLQLQLGENFDKIANTVLNDQKVHEQVNEILKNAVLKELGLTESIAA